MSELYLEELRYQLGEDPEPWIERMQRVQGVYAYDDAKMVLLAEMCMKKPTSDFVHQFSRNDIQAVYTGFRRLYALCKRVDTERAFKWALLHVRCAGRHNPKNGLPEVKLKSSSSLSSSSSPAEEISVTGKDEMLRFPEYSFPIPCEFGDFCINDVIKFDQTLVYNHVSSKRGTVSKPYKRTVVGRVAYKADGVELTASMRNDSLRMSENFSQSDEEPTYTIEVYWSRGVKPVLTSEPFIIKAHNLELLNPVRQRWGNEQNRVREMEKLKGNLGTGRTRCRNILKSIRTIDTGRRPEYCTKLVF
ncbi:hypothetical protein KC19_9G156000 [Ceratodon purpureus]|uniref:DUF7699 domain-containing protein n=1 Tax=Ceratodon purpureus TaxID=3225 RepID=A0A8T0GU72_CERPU|nr:hypothetical protein KC19_9G156000 [Ceratodon purpureus]